MLRPTSPPLQGDPYLLNALCSQQLRPVHAEQQEAAEGHSEGQGSQVEHARKRHGTQALAGPVPAWACQ
eukprot:scaffold302921_cov18-Tisochrysis_lutea.AAC.1